MNVASFYNAGSFIFITHQMMIVDLTVRGVVVLISQTVTTGGIRFLLISYSIRKPKSTHQSCSTSKVTLKLPSNDVRFLIFQSIDSSMCSFSVFRFSPVES
ncbi:hypothetical protein HanRHA438_Chr09g0404581 [Helianthus annuus]|nr:hypothetical protein HanRHA438_Chr09g0404581 [Helianthus annuus]